MAIDDRELTRPFAHSVVFYEDDAEFFEAATGFVVDGGPNALAIAVVTPEHRALLAGNFGDARVIDAATLLGQFTSEGALDEAAFDVHVGHLIRRAVHEGRPVRVVGEMVALLWAAGHVAQAVELESFWAQLAETVPFALMCAYPSTLVLDHDDPSRVNDVCAAHHPVRVPGRTQDAAVRAFVAAPPSVGEARRFVAKEVGVVAQQQLDKQQLDKLLVIASELTTNAVQHARTPFVVGVSACDNGICVTVRDRSVTEIGPTPAPTESECGRGLIVVDALADAWGVHWTSLGKVVWAEVR